MLRRSGPKQAVGPVDTGACHKHKVSLQVGCKYGPRHQLRLRQCSYNKQSGNWMMLRGIVRQRLLYVTYIGLHVCLRRLVGSVDPSLTQAQLHQAVNDFNR